MFKLLFLSMAGVAALGAYNLSTGHDLFHLPGARTIRTAVHGTVENTVRNGVSSTAHEASADLKERAAEVKDQASASVHAAALTTKIKAKMALDDVVKARDINVTTNGTTVTLTGTVSSKAERERALSLARETDGVTRVIDELHAG